MQIFNKYFKIALIFIILLEILSYFGYLYPIFNKICFFVILFFFLVLSLKKLEYGIYILLAELFIGSKGYLFFLDIDGVLISIRMGFFLIIMAVGLMYFAKNQKILIDKIINNKLIFSLYGLLGLAIIWGVVNGFLKDNGFDNVLFDFNGYLFFALLLPFAFEINNWNKIKNVLNVFFASITYLGIKTLFLLWFFSHELGYYLESVYKWVRNSGVGEITMMPDSGFARIFIQSQIFELVGIFIILMLVLYIIKNRELRIMNYELWYLMGILALSISGILISWSRSFWVGGAAGLVILLVILIYQKIKFKEFGKILGIGLVCTVISIVLIFAVVKVPLPGFGYGAFGAGLVSERATSLTGEAGAGSRWNLLPELWGEVKEAVIFGKGFGETVIYKSEDPRVVASSPTGEYTTYAFEWGYLDIWLKMGIIGLLVYLGLILSLLIKGLKKANEIKDLQKYLVYGLIVGLIAVCATSFFSPYLNHPLGIGYILLYTVLII